MHLLAKLLLILICSFFVGISLSWYKNYEYESRIRNYFENGFVPILEKQMDGKIIQIERNTLKKEIIKKITNSRDYFLVVGENGGGKSTIMRELCKENQLMMITVPENPSFLPEKWAEAFGFISDDHVQLSLQQVKSKFEKYRLKYGPPNYTFTLVFDDIDFLFDKDPELLIELQRWAKNMLGITKVIFISSKGLVPLLLMKENSASRMKTIEIPDPTEDENTDFILKNLPSNSTRSELVNEILKITGRRLLDINKFVENIQIGQTIEEIKVEQFRRIYGEWMPLLSSKRRDMFLKLLDTLLPLSERKLVFKDAIEILDLVREKDENEYREKKKIYEDNYSLLFKLNVIAFHPANFTVSISSQIHRNFAIEQILNNEKYTQNNKTSRNWW